MLVGQTRYIIRITNALRSPRLVGYMRSTGFAYRKNADGTIDSICLSCFLTAAKARSVEELAVAEKSHECDETILGDRDKLPKEFADFNSR